MKKVAFSSISQKAFLLIFMSMISLCAYSQRQDFKSYDGIFSQGDIPMDMRKTVKELYEEDKSRMRKYTDKRRSGRNEGVLECSYAINKMAQSGQILYGDKITQWINEIADTLLKDNPQLRSELRFYTYKSPAVNAFATGQGMIFVSLGLVARLDNEAQMAYVLSHEIVHYVCNHTWESINAKAEKKRRRDFEKIISKHNRSHRMEIEADSIGLIDYYLPSNYYNKISDEVMDILLHSDYASQNIPFDTAYFNTQYYKLPTNIWLKNIDSLEIDENKADTASTHPNIGKRRALTYRLTRNEKESGEKFLCSTPQEFQDIKYLAQMETIRKLTINGAYVRAFYESWCLLKTYPDNSFLEKVMAYSLYAIAKYKNAYNTNVVIGDYKDNEGEIQQLHHSLSEMKSADLMVLAIRELHKYKLKHGNTAHISKITTDAVQTLALAEGVPLNYFSKEPPSTNENNDNKASKPLNKYERLKQGGKNTSDVADIRKYAFTDFLLTNDDFKNSFEEHLNIKLDTNCSNNNILILNPNYRYYYANGDFDIKTSERKEAKLSDMLVKVVKKTGANAIEYNGHLLRKQTSDTFYNQYMALNEWSREINNHVNLQHISQPEVDKIFSTWNADGVLWANVSSTAWQGFYHFPIPLPLPYTTYRNIAEKCNTETNTVFVDKNGKATKGETEEVNRNDEKAVVMQQLYSSYTAKNNPGYLGKHLLIGISGSPFIGVNTLENYNRYNGALDLGLKIEATVDKQHSITTGFKIYTTEGYVVNTLELGVRKYRKAAIAPLGPYMQISLQGRMVPYPRVITPTYKNITPNDDKKTSIISFAPTLTLGRTYIHWNTIQMDYFYTFSYAINSVTHYENIKGFYIGLGLGISLLAF